MEDETRRDNKSSMTVSRLSAHWVSDDTEAYTINIYPGSGNRLRLTRIYSTQWLCNYNMLYYPFDTQVSLQPLHTWYSPPCRPVPSSCSQQETPKHS